MKTVRFLLPLLAACGGAPFTVLDGQSPTTTPDGGSVEATDAATDQDARPPTDAAPSIPDAAAPVEATAPEAAPACTPVPVPGPTWSCGSSVEQGYFVYCVNNSPIGETEETMPPACRACLETFSCECLLREIVAHPNVTHPCGVGVTPSCATLARGEVSVTCP